MAAERFRMGMFVVIVAAGLSFAQTGSSFTDARDGNKYKTVRIGKQTWMAENLNFAASGSKCYDNKAENCDKYGLLYNWSTARQACPAGWRLPTDAYWTALEDAVGDEEIEGKKLKSKTGWNYGGNGTDEYSFSALPGGNGNSSVRF